MRRSIRSALPSALLTTLCALTAGPAAAQDAVAVESEIVGVTVYQDRALVTRQATVDLSGGTARVVLGHLPVSLDDRSLRGRARGGVLLGLDVELVHLTEENRAAVREAESAYRDAALKHEAEQMELDEQKALLEMLASLRATTAERTGRELGAGGGPDVAGIRKMLDLIVEESGKARRKLLAQVPRVEEARRAAEAAKAHLESLRSAGGRTEKTVVATIQPSGEGTAEGVIELSYVVPDATWEPVYDLRVDGDFSGANLEVGALVRQRSGEDWVGVPLELTTAEPAAGASPPEPQPWYVDIARPAAGYGVAAERGRLAAPRAALKLEEAELEDSMDALEVRVRRSGVVVAFQSHTAETVEADGQPARIALGTFVLEPDVRWTAYPKVTPRVFVTTQLTNDTGTALPRGETRVYVGPDYVGPHALEDWGLGEEIEVGLGVDRLVDVEREARVNRRETEGIFSKDRIHKRAFNLRVENHRERAIAVRLFDNVPVSRDEELEVELTRNTLALATLSPREAEQNQARGILEWHFSLAAGAAQEIDFAFKLTHPDEMSISGFDD